LTGRGQNWNIISVSHYCSKRKIKIRNDENLLKFKLDDVHRGVYRTNNRRFEGLKFKTRIAGVTPPSGIKYVWWEGK
jgi:hypothetical protein